MRFVVSCLVFALVVAAQMGHPASVRAQSDDLKPPPPLEKLRAFLKEKAVSRPRLDPPPIGIRPGKLVSARVDWDEVNRLLTEGAPPGNRPPLPALPRLPGFQELSVDDAPTVDRQEITPILIPVLVPSSDSIRSSLQLFGQVDSYSAIATADDGVDLRISGSRKKLVVPDGATVRERLKQLRTEKPPLPSFGARYVITRSESSTDLSFSRFGCGYVISLICDDPVNDARCAEDGYIRNLASSMSLLNPRAAQKAREAQEQSVQEEAPEELTERDGAKEPAVQEDPPSPEADSTNEEEPSAHTAKPVETQQALSDTNGATFSYLPAGELLPQSGPGFVDMTVYRADIIFPTEDRAFLNSQVYRYGGYYGSLNGMEGGQCAPENFQYPWQDTFCEKRSREQELCPGGGHEGLDIRPATCEKDAHWAVAVEDARVIDLRRHWVTLQTPDGTLYNYLHLNMKRLLVALGDEVKQGDRIGLISNDFYKSDGSSVPTTIHLHFEMYENYVTEEEGDPLFTKVNPYTTLVHAYDKRLRGE